jgi:hypothetical protein
LAKHFDQPVPTPIGTRSEIRTKSTPNPAAPRALFSVAVALAIIGGLLSCVIAIETWDRIELDGEHR